MKRKCLLLPEKSEVYRSTRTGSCFTVCHFTLTEDLEKVSGIQDDVLKRHRATHGEKTGNKYEERADDSFSAKEIKEKYDKNKRISMQVAVNRDDAGPVFFSKDRK
jgi:hypothetical protein